MVRAAGKLLTVVAVVVAAMAGMRRPLLGKRREARRSWAGERARDSG
jgi:hypothetical protein